VMRYTPRCVYQARRTNHRGGTRAVLLGFSSDIWGDPLASRTLALIPNGRSSGVTRILLSMLPLSVCERLFRQRASERIEHLFPQEAEPNGTKVHARRPRTGR
jgi:hypothetical protein